MATTSHVLGLLTLAARFAAEGEPAAAAQRAEDAVQELLELAALPASERRRGGPEHASQAIQRVMSAMRWNGED